MTTLSRTMAAVFLVVLTLPQVAEANRPLITDDSGVAELNEIELELWAELDVGDGTTDLPVAPLGNAELIFSAIPGWEIALGGGLGVDLDGEFTVVSPTFETKVELLPVKDGFNPGVAVVAGAIPPIGVGSEPADDTTLYAIVPATLRPTDGLDVHINAGWVTTFEEDGLQSGRPFWGLAAAWSPICPCLTVVGEVVADDPSVAFDSTVLGQLGLRWAATNNAVFDVGFASDPSLDWMAQVGVTWVTDVFVADPID